MKKNIFEQEKLSKMQKQILKKMGIKPTFKNFENLTPEQVNVYNKYRQKKVGKKEYDYFELMEFYSEDKSIFDYKNLVELDEENFHFQEKSREEGIAEQRLWQEKRGEKQSPEYKAKEYKTLYLLGDWFRALEIDYFNEKKRNLIYGTLISARSYILTKVSEGLSDEINKKYPSVSVKPYGVGMFQKIPDSKLLTMTETEVRAAGKEKELKKANRELFRLTVETDEIEKDILNRIKKYEGYTFKKTYEDDFIQKDSQSFIIGGFEAAEDISYKTFFKDFYKRQQPVEILDRIADELVKKYKKIILEKKKKNHIYPQDKKLRELIERKKSEK